MRPSMYERDHVASTSEMGGRIFEPLVHSQQTLDGDGLGGADRPIHRVAVPEHLVGGDVDVGLARSAAASARSRARAAGP
ncbi:MAG TPA: hypothetical protein VGR26_10335 [Acidimicrobiales bacterium]|nr:hypothetical protein [Acidimicrobiales bacterium]